VDPLVLPSAHRNQCSLLPCHRPCFPLHSSPAPAHSGHSPSSCAGPGGAPRRGAAHRTGRFVPRPPEHRRDAAGPLFSVSHPTALSRPLSLSVAHSQHTPGRAGSPKPPPTSPHRRLSVGTPSAAGELTLLVATSAMCPLVLLTMPGRRTVCP
jgi:hypothetical protein